MKVTEAGRITCEVENIRAVCAYLAREAQARWAFAPPQRGAWRHKDRFRQRKSSQHNTPNIATKWTPDTPPDHYLKKRKQFFGWCTWQSCGLWLLMSAVFFFLSWLGGKKKWGFPYVVRFSHKPCFTRFASFLCFDWSHFKLPFFNFIISWGTSSAFFFYGAVEKHKKREKHGLCEKRNVVTLHCCVWA